MRRWLTFAGPPGELHAEQSRSWAGGLRAGTSTANLPALMDRLHFRAVGAYGLGGLRVRREGDRVVLVLPGGAPGLVFDRLGDELSDRHAARWWRLGGWLMRPSADAAFGLGLELGDDRARAWVRTERFPSLFLAPGVPPWAGTVYTTFHAHVSFAYLELLRAQLAR